MCVFHGVRATNEKGKIDTEKVIMEVRKKDGTFQETPHTRNLLAV